MDFIHLGDRPHREIIEYVGLLNVSKKFNDLSVKFAPIILTGYLDTRVEQNINLMNSLNRLFSENAYLKTQKFKRIDLLKVHGYLANFRLGGDIRPKAISLYPTYRLPSQFFLHQTLKHLKIHRSHQTSQVFSVADLKNLETIVCINMWVTGMEDLQDLKKISIENQFGTTGCDNQIYKDKVGPYRRYDILKNLPSLEYLCISITNEASQVSSKYLPGRIVIFIENINPKIRSIDLYGEGKYDYNVVFYTHDMIPEEESFRSLRQVNIKNCSHFTNKKIKDVVEKNGQIIKYGRKHKYPYYPDYSGYIV